MSDYDLPSWPPPGAFKYACPDCEEGNVHRIHSQRMCPYCWAGTIHHHTDKSLPEWPPAGRPEVQREFVFEGRACPYCAAGVPHDTSHRLHAYADPIEINP